MYGKTKRIKNNIPYQLAISENKTLALGCQRSGANNDDRVRPPGNINPSPFRSGHFGRSRSADHSADFPDQKEAADVQSIRGFKTARLRERPLFHREISY
jgi:hypothetical protein